MRPLTTFQSLYAVRILQFVVTAHLPWAVPLPLEDAVEHLISLWLRSPYSWQALADEILSASSFSVQDILEPLPEEGSPATRNPPAINPHLNPHLNP